MPRGSSKSNGWFVADREGIRALNADKPKSFVVRELVQNALDEPGVTFVEVLLEPIPHTAKVVLVVEDDAPEGFYDLRHAYTLFADTRKRVDPEMRGRFNLGEKQVLSLCDEAKITTTTGTVIFNKDGTRETNKAIRSVGSNFTAMLAMTRAEMAEVIETVSTFLVPKDIKVRFNREEIEYRAPIKTFETKLQTEYADAEGIMRRTVRKTTVEIVEPDDGETPMLYEMGLPVCETEDRWHYNVSQRVPLGADRDTVSAAFLQDLRAEVLNRMYEKLSEEEAADKWVQEAIQDDRVEGDAVKAVIVKQHGDRAFVPTPGDPQATERAIDAGYNIVSANAYSRSAWDNIRTKTQELPSATTVSGKTRFVGGISLKPFEVTAGMEQVRYLTEFIARHCLRLEVSVGFLKCKESDMAACYGSRNLTFNISKLGKRFFSPLASPAQIDLIVHELGHEYGGHYDMSYHEALTKMSGILAMTDPDTIREAALGES